MVPSGSSSPVSSSSTLTNSESNLGGKIEITGVLTPTTPAHASLITTASAIVESLASRHSSTIFLYDTAEQTGIGRLAKQWVQHASGAQIVQMQNRSGAGLIIEGRLSRSTSTQTERSGTLTALTDPRGLTQMLPTLMSFPRPNAAGRLVIQVPGLSPVSPSLTLTSSLASFTSSLAILPDTFVVLLSATAKETADLASLSYSLLNFHIIHIFDQYATAREICRLSYPSTVPQGSVDEGMRSSGYSFFEYHGSPHAEHVFLALKGSFGLAVEGLATQLSGVGVITIRVLRPWRSEALRGAVPATSKVLHVLDDVLWDGSSSPLLQDVLGSFIDTRGHLTVRHHGITQATLSQLLNPTALQNFISQAAGIPLSPSIPTPVPSNLKKLLFFGTPSSTLCNLPNIIAQPFFSHPSIQARLLTDFDAFSKVGGLSASRLLLASKGTSGIDLPTSIVLPVEAGEEVADFVSVLDENLLKTHDVFKASRVKSLVLLFSKWSVEEILANLPATSLEVIRTRELSLYSLNCQIILESLPKSKEVDSQRLESVLGHLAFLRIYVGLACTLDGLENVARALYGDFVGSVSVSKIVGRLWEGILQVKVPPEDSAVCLPDAKPSSLKSFEFNSVELESIQAVGDDAQQAPAMSRWHDAAKNIVFREAFHLSPSVPDDTAAQIASLRPDVEDRTYLVTCAVNRRLTPSTYDRNVFHLEFDTSGTGLKYEIGEALGVHGWNDEREVLDFCSWYGLDPDALVSMPVPASNRTSGGVPLRHIRTVFQALQQQIDIFGKPSKSFYSSLADHAKSRDHQMALRFIGAPEGSATLKKLMEIDTVSFADVLAIYDSARPDFAILCDLIGDIKPRHYSIASAQSAVGDRVDLLVVTVDWITPSGSPKYGQCTRYLAGLKVGQKVTVSIKPSVMKLPPDNMQPIVMAGLGTGAAPFRAFIQHRAHLSSQNIPIGPLIYYFGSRHRSQEYLYGEELEAYIAAGVITHAGFAFSRDQKKKIYIQHKMLEDGKMLAEMLGDSDMITSVPRPKGVFYLCGPTWPVPDVYEALLGALGEYGGYSREGAMEHIENLKEEERYVLEVY